MEDGRVIERGTHHDLLAAGARCATLVRLASAVNHVACYFS
jgi:ABC-type multidrug transport system fused ATPase/permease subunit